MKGQFQALFRIKPRVAVCLVIKLQLFIQDIAPPTRTFRDVLSCQFKMYTSRHCSLSPMDLKKRPDFLENIIEVPCLVPCLGRIGVAVHGIAAPDNMQALFFHLLSQFWQILINLISPEAGDKGHSSCFIFRV